MKIWIDDERPVPDETWTLATTAQGGISLIATHAAEEMIEWVSIDYTLGYSSQTDNGDTVIRWIVENKPPIGKITAHSSSWSGRELIIEIGKRGGVEVTAYQS